MSEIADFQALVERVVRSDGGSRERMRPVIAKELLHYDILFALEQEGLLDRVTFQGGTSLRLCYGSPRHSEDLDFVGGREFAATQLLSMKSCIERYVGGRYGLEVTVKEPREVIMEPDGKSVRVHKWQIRVVTAPERPDLPKQMIKVEVASVPAHTRVPQLLRQNYDFLPDGYQDMLIMTEAREEIMADKLVSLVDCPYLRHRDIWDLLWLHQQGVEVDGALVRLKLADYSVQEYADKTGGMIERLPRIIHGADFRDQMSRFIPLDVQERTLLKDNFLIALQDTVIRLLTQAKSADAF